MREEQETERMKDPVIYEGIFFDREEVEELFCRIRGERRHPEFPSDPHVTTEYRPKTLHPEFYGREVEVRILRYVDAPAALPDGSDQGFNEAVLVEVLGEDALSRWVRSNPKRFHITGSFEKKGDAKLSEYLPFEEGLDPGELRLTGRFGGWTKEGILFD